MSTTNMLRRPTTLEEYDAAWERVDIEEIYNHGLAFQPQASDVIVSSFSKSGTTWTQQIVHGLRSRGSMEFEEISSVVPWIETAGVIGLELDGPQPGPFRAYKSHLDYERVPKGGRYIVSIRHPYDVCLSFYHFMEGWFFEPGTIGPQEFARHDFLGREGGQSYWGHLASWWQVRQQANVLLLTFESMKENLAWAVRRIAAFLGVELDAELERLVIQQSSYPFMRAHIHQFDDHILAGVFNRMAGIPNGNSDKVRNGHSGEGDEKLPDEIKEEVDQRWQREIGEPYGLADYQALRAVLEDGA